MSGGGGDGPGCPLWIISFADMISNLVIFFILMATYGTSAAGERNGKASGDPGNFGESAAARPNLIAPKPLPGARRGTEGSEGKSQRTSTERSAEFDRMVQSDAFNQKPEFERLADGVRIVLLSDRIFDHSRSRLTDHGKRSLRELGIFFLAERVSVEIAAFVDEGANRLSDFDDETALRRAQCTVAAAALVGEAGFPPDRIAINPRAKDGRAPAKATAVARSEARRIQLTFTELR